MKKSVSFLFAFCTLLMTAAQFTPNYDEHKVPDFQLPDPLTTFRGEKITSSKKWIEKRRPELLKFFGNQVYGQVPDKLDSISFALIEQHGVALNGGAIRKQVEVTLSNNKKHLRFHMLIYLPKDIPKAPLFLGYNFHGNHTITADPKVIITKAWNINNDELGITENIATESSRGKLANRWALEKIIKSGFGLATIFYGEIDPDKNDFTDGIHSLFYTNDQARPDSDQWGSIAAWAFGLSRAMDYLVEDPQIGKVLVFGHSRLGKAALWAGATDDRFAAVISNNSGCGGAALSKRKYGETIGRINDFFPHWFCDNFKAFNENEEALPVDQHELLALIAPRPLYVASAVEDKWSDPTGEFLGAYYATPVYNLFGKEGITSKNSPEINKPIQHTVSYHLREGGHDVTAYDWEQYVRWAKKFLN
ncbi:MAG: acetylxylan esterase [Maribacter sp.]|nr:acetylxylan esterase [Maribacter sp.]